MLEILVESMNHNIMSLQSGVADVKAVVTKNKEGAHPHLVGVF